jgi:hypothetical protein
MVMKSAMVTTVAAEVACPECDQGMPGPMNKSFVWYPDDAESVVARGRMFCEECGAQLRIPAALRKLAEG